MASSISHEITQPLTAVRTNAEVAQELLAGPEPDLEEVRSALTDIVSDSHRMSELLQNIRELFGNRKREKEQVDVNDVALKTLQIEDGELAKQFRSQVVDSALVLSNGAYYRKFSRLAQSYLSKSCLLAPIT